MTKDRIKVIPIGIIHSPILEKESSPIQSSRSDLEASVEIYPQFLEGLQGIEEFCHLSWINCNGSDNSSGLHSTC